MVEVIGVVQCGVPTLLYVCTNDVRLLAFFPQHLVIWTLMAKSTKG
jgi:hypothetical protein